MPSRAKQTQMIERVAGGGGQRARAAAARRGESAVILVVAEHRQGALNRATWETVAAAQLLSERLGGASAQNRHTWSAAGRAAQELAAAGVGDVLTIDDPALETLHPGRLRDGTGRALSRRCRPGSSLCRTRTRHAISCRRLPPVSTSRSSPTSQPSPERLTPRRFFDRCSRENSLPKFVRREAIPVFVTFQIGAFRADQVRKGSSPSAVSARGGHDRSLGDSPGAGGAFPGGAARGRPESGGAHCRRRTWHQVEGAAAGRRGACRRARRRAGRVTTHLRQRMASDGTSGRQLGSDGGAEAVCGARDFRRDPASRRHEGIADDRCHQQGPRTHPSSRLPTTASSAICSRSCPPSSRSSRGNDETTKATKLTNLTIELRCLGDLRAFVVDRLWSVTPSTSMS